MEQGTTEYNNEYSARCNPTIRSSGGHTIIMNEIYLNNRLLHYVVSNHSINHIMLVEKISNLVLVKHPSCGAGLDLCNTLELRTSNY